MEDTKNTLKLNGKEEEFPKICVFSMMFALGGINMLREFINSYQYLREYENENKIIFNSPDKLSQYFKSQLAYFKEKEYFLVAYFDSSMHILSCEKYEGTVNACVVHPRELVKRAIQLDSTGIALSHNHPSGNINPSKEDIAMTKRVMAIFNPMDIRVYDHIIIGDDKHFSLNQNGYMNENVGISKVSDYQRLNLKSFAEIEEEEELSF